MKHVFFHTFWLLISIFSFGASANGQNPYDYCDSAYTIHTPKKWCADFSSEGATTSGSDMVTCFANSGKDVWFKFTAVGTILKVSVKGNGKKRLNQPEFVIFQGDCNGQINLLGCVRARKGQHYIGMRRDDIIEGKTYLVSVQDATQGVGAFQLCITNYSPKLITKNKHKKRKKLIKEFSKDLKPGEEFAIPKLNFDANSYEIKSSFIPILFEIVEYLKSSPNVKVEVGGHTNSHCDDAYCQELSFNRAKAIADFIIAKGVDQSQITYQGYGKSRPLYKSKSKQAKNQRVAIKVLVVR